MDSIKIKHRIRWGSVPEPLIEDQRLSTDARLAAIWMATKPDGWQIRIGVMIGRLGLTEGRWQAARRELIGCGYLCSVRRQAPNGQIFWDQSFDPVPATPASAEQPQPQAQAQPQATEPARPADDIPPQILEEMAAAAATAKNKEAYMAALAKKYREGNYVRASAQTDQGGQGGQGGRQKRLLDLRVELRTIRSRIRADRNLGLEPQPGDRAELDRLAAEIAGIEKSSSNTPDAPAGARARATRGP